MVRAHSQITPLFNSMMPGSSIPMLCASRPDTAMRAFVVVNDAPSSSETKQTGMA